MTDCVVATGPEYFLWLFNVQAGIAVISFIDPQFSDQIVKTQQTQDHKQINTS